MEKRIWLITGISSGLGQAMAQTAIKKGDFVIGSFRTIAQTEAFNQQNKGKAFAVTMDVTNEKDIEKVHNTILEKFGKIDILVNNAGFGFAGAVEEASLNEVKAVFESNFFGVLQLTQKFLPLFRKQKSGHIIQISSHGGFKAFPGFGIYNASKFAVEGFSEALAIEVAPLGIKLTIVEPGPFRTKFADQGFKTTQKVIEDYAATSGAFKERMKTVNGQQEGDPGKAADAIFDITTIENPPLRLPLGKIALISLQTKLDSVQKDMDQFRSVAESVVF